MSCFERLPNEHICLIQYSNINSYTTFDSSEPDAASSLKSALSVLVGPACVILDRSPLKTEVMLDQDVLEELGLKMTSGKQTPSIICTALSALGDFVKEVTIYMYLHRGVAWVKT